MHDFHAPVTESAILHLIVDFALLFIASEATEATSKLPDNQLYSFEKIGIAAFAFLLIASEATEAASKLPDNQPY